MIARWEQGRAAIDALLADRRLERVAPSRELADALVDQAQRHQFDWLRRTRNAAEYPMPETPPITPVDARDALPLATTIVNIAARVVPTMPVY